MPTVPVAQSPFAQALAALFQARGWLREDWTNHLNVPSCRVDGWLEDHDMPDDREMSMILRAFTPQYDCPPEIATAAAPALEQFWSVMARYEAGEDVSPRFPDPLFRAAMVTRMTNHAKLVHLEDLISRFPAHKRPEIYDRLISKAGKYLRE